MFSNTLFRLWWIVGSFTITFGDSALFLDKLGLLTFLSMMIEAIRRTIWAVLRVENEFHNNFEQYRDMIIIPPIKEENDD